MANQLGPLGTKIIGKTAEGRPIVQNPDGSVSTERTITEKIDGKWVNIPTMYGGKEVDPDTAVDIYRKNKGHDPETGRKLPTFTSLEQAEAAAKARSHNDLGKYGDMSGVDEQLKLEYQQGLEAFQQAQKERAEFDEYVRQRNAGGVIRGGSATRSGPSPGALIGGTVGAVAGGVLTAPGGGGGSFPGALIGAGLGELAQQQYDRFTNSAYAPANTQDALTRVGTEVGAAAVGELTAGALRLARPVRYAQPRSLTQEQHQTKAVLDKHQIPYTPDQITGSPFHSFSRSLADSGLLSEGTMQEFVKDQSAAIRGAVKGVADTMGQHVPPDVLGQQVIKHIRHEDKTLTDTVIQPLYNQIDRDLAYKERRVMVPETTNKGDLRLPLSATGPSPLDNIILYHGSTKEGSAAIEDGGFLGGGFDVFLTPDKSKASFYAKNGGKVFSVRASDLPQGVLQQLQDEGHDLKNIGEVTVPSWGGWKDVRIPTREGGKSASEFSNRVSTGKMIEKTVVDGGLLVDQKPVKDLFQQEVLNLERTATNQNQPALLRSAAYQSMKRFLALPDSGQWVDAHTVLKEVRRDLRDLENPTNVATEVLKDKSVLTRAEKVLEKQLETALQASPNPAHQVDLNLWKQAQGEVKGRSERLRNEVILKFTKAIDEHGGEKGLQQFVNSMTPDDMAKVMTATKSDPALQGALRRSYLEDKIIKAGGMDDADAPFNAEKFRKSLFGKDEMNSRKSEVLLDPTQKQKLKEFTNAVSDIQNGPQSKFGIFLKMKSAQALMTLSAGSLATLGLISGRQGDTGSAAVELGGAATIILGPKVLANLMTNPKAVEYMIQGLRYTATDKSNTVRVVRELMRLDQGFARAVQAGASTYMAEQTSGPLHRTAESVSKSVQSTLPQFGLGNFQQ